MKIAFVYDAVYPWVKGGAEKRIYEVGKRLADMGNEVHVFGIKWWDGEEIMMTEGLVLHGVCGARELYLNGRRSIPEAVIFSLNLLPHLLREKYDVMDVSVFPYFSCFSVKLVSILRRTPMITTWHEVWGNYWYNYMGLSGFFGKQVEALVSKLTHKSIVVSGKTKKGLESLGVMGQNISEVPNGIDLKKINNISQSIYKCDIIFVGRLIKEKNVDILIEAVDIVRKTLPGIRVHIIGDGPEKERIMGIVTGRGLANNVTFFGFMDYIEVIARIKSSKVLVLPSSREGFGMVVIEAYACGVPVITVNCPRNAAYELVNEGSGFIVDLDAKEISDSILKIIIDPKLYENMSKNALFASREYDWNKVVKLLMSQYMDLIKNYRRK
jgi:glycosyltransferase involved in cell wall biosynthesis